MLIVPAIMLTLCAVILGVIPFVGSDNDEIKVTYNEKIVCLTFAALFALSAIIVSLHI